MAEMSFLLDGVALGLGLVEALPVSMKYGEFLGLISLKAFSFFFIETRSRWGIFYFFSSVTSFTVSPFGASSTITVLV